jgi:hypothetical protein
MIFIFIYEIVRKVTLILNLVFHPLFRRRKILLKKQLLQFSTFVSLFTEGAKEQRIIFSVAAAKYVSEKRVSHG